MSQCLLKVKSYVKWKNAYNLLSSFFVFCVDVTYILYLFQFSQLRKLPILWYTRFPTTIRSLNHFCTTICMVPADQRTSCSGKDLKVVYFSSGTWKAQKRKQVHPSRKQYFIQLVYSWTQKISINVKLRSGKSS